MRPDKNSLDYISDDNLPVVLFLMYHVPVESNSLASSIGQELRNGSSQSASFGIPLNGTCIVPERKETSYSVNAILMFLSDEGAFLDDSCETKPVKRFVGVFCGTDVDGHHHVFSERAVGLPTVFARFLTSPSVAKD